MSEIINGVPIGDLPGIESVPDDSMLVVEFLGKAYHMPGAVLRQMIQDVLDSMGDSVDDVTEARLTAAIETVLSSGKYNGVSPLVEVLDEEDGTSVIHIIDAFGVKKYPVEVKGARNAVQYVEQELTDEQKAQARKNIGVGDGTGTADAVQYVPQTLTTEQQTQARNNIGIPEFTSGLMVIVNPNYDLTSQHVMMDWGHVFADGTRFDNRFEFDVPYSAYELARRNGYTKDELTFYKEMSSNLGNPKADSLQIDSDTGTLMLLSAGEPIGEGVPIPTGDSNVFVGNYDTVTFTEIKTAHDAGKVCFLDFKGIPFLLLGVDDTEALFVREMNENQDYEVTIAANGEKSFKILDKNISDVYVAGLFSVKYAEAKAAYEAGKACFVTYGALLCPLTVLDEEKAEFVGMLTPHIGMKGILYADGTYNFQYVHSNAVQTVAQSLTEEKKAQARANIGALSTADVDTVLQQAKDSGQFDGKDGYTPVKGKDYFDGYTPVKGKDYFDGANGKTAYAYAQDGGYTGTEAEFAVKLASGSEPLKVTLSGNDTDGYTADKTVAEIYAARNAGRDVYMVGGVVTYQLSYLNSSFAAFSYTMASRNAIEIISVIMMSGVAPTRIHQTIDDSYVKYTAQSLDEEYKLQARTNIGAAAAADLSNYVTTGTAQTITGAKTFNAPANVAGTEQHTVKFKTSNGGAIIFGKEAANSGTMLRFDQVDGTTRLRFRGSATAGAIVWEQPEQGAQLYVDLGKQGVDKHRITFPSSEGTLALTSGNVNTATIPLGFSSRKTNGNWGNTDGTTVTCWIDSTGGGIDFRRDNPSSGKLSMKLDGRVYVNEGKNPVMGTEYANGFWGMTSPDGENNVWIRTTTQGIIPYQSGGSGAGHCNLGTSSWYFANAYIDNVYGSNFSGLSAKATADANGNNIASTYANKTVANTFNGEQKMVNSTHCPTMNDIAAGVGCSLKNARACDNQLIVAEIFAPTATVTDSKINMSSVAGEIGFYHGGSGSGGQFSGKTQLARITSAGIYEGSTLLSNKYLAKSGGTMTGPLTITGGDAATAGKIILNNTGKGQITDSGVATLFGFTSTSNLTVGHSYYNLVMRGKASRPTYNGANVALVSDVVEAANGALKVTLSGNDTDGYTVDKTFAEIKTAWEAGRYVYVTNGVIVCNPCYFSASLAAVFSYTRATGDGVEVWSVMVNNLGTKPTVVKKTITA